MTKQSPTLKDSQKTHQGYVLASVLFLALTLVCFSFLKKTAIPQKVDFLIQFFVLPFTIICYVVQRYLYKKKLVRWYTNAEISVSQKRDEFLQFAHVQWLIILVPIIINIILFLLTGNFAYVGLGVLLIFVLALQLPSKLKMSVLFRCKQEEL